MIKTVIFDIGNVLADFSWEPFYRSFGFSEEIFERLANATVRSEQWNELDRGALTTEEILASFEANDPELKDILKQVFTDVGPMVTKRDYASQWVKSIKQQGCQVLYLSNFGELTRAHCAPALEFMDYMDGGIMSYECKLIKPEPEIYKALVEKYQLNPQECVFIDDLAVNIKAAEAMGFHTILATDHETVVHSLSAMGITDYRKDGGTRCIPETKKFK